MTNAPNSRKTHIIRIFGTNKDGDRIEDLWIDVERIDVWKTALQMPPELQWQGTQRKLLWDDDPNGDSYQADGTPSRNLQILKVCDPEANDDVTDPDEWVPLKVIKAIRPRNASGQDYNDGGKMERFLAFSTNEELQSSRKVTARRITHYDTNYDDQIQAAAAADPNLKEYVIPADDYQKIDGTKDENQYVEHEIIKALKTRGNTAHQTKARQLKMLNQYLIDESDDATLEITGPGGFNPPYRIDPYQNIVNVSFGGLAVEFFGPTQRGGPSYVQFPAALNCARGTISLWFMAPSEVLSAAQQEFAAWRGTGQPRPKRMLGMVPLVVGGPPPVRKKADSVLRDIGSTPTQEFWSWSDGSGAPECDGAGWVHNEEFDVPAGVWREPHDEFNGQTATDLDPSYIAIDCAGAYPALSIHLVMPGGNTATFEGSSPAFASVTGPDVVRFRSGGGACGPEFIVPSPNPGTPICYAEVDTIEQTFTTDSNADVTLAHRPETFRTLPLARSGDPGLNGSLDVRDNADQTYGGQRIVPDRWHHLLFSFDFTSTVVTEGKKNEPPSTSDIGDRTTSACRMFIAFDDVNLTGSDLSCYWPQGYGDKNAILTVNGYYVAADAATDQSVGPNIDCRGNSVTLNIVTQKPTYNFTPEPLALGAAPIGLPATETFSERVRNTKAAAFQFFADAVVDPASPDVRRGFVTDKGRASKPEAAVEVMGKEPEILLYKRSDWKTARNAGTLGDPVNPTGVAVGRIDSFSPDPNLNA